VALALFFLLGRLPPRARAAADAGGERRAIPSSEVAERAARIGVHRERGARGQVVRDPPAAEQERPRPAGHRRPREAVAVVARARERQEQLARAQAARVGGDAGERKLGIPRDEARARRIDELAEGEAA
jgi:hypothetical protein